MPGIIALIVFIAIIMAVAQFLDAHPGSVQLLLFGGYIVLSVYIYRKFSKSNWHRTHLREIDARRQQREAVARAATQKLEEVKRLADWAAYTPPDYSQFMRDVECPNYYAVNAASAFIAAACLRSKDYLQPYFTVDQYQSTYNALVSSTRLALLRYCNALPFEYRAPRDDSPFIISIAPTDEDLADANRALAAEFRGDDGPVLGPQRAYNYFSKPREPTKPSKHSWDDEGKYYKEQMREYKDELRAYEKERKEWEKSEDDLFESQTLTQQIFWNTPLYPHASSFIPDPFKISFDIPNQARFAGTWIIAPSGRGKTNLLHNLIAEDRKSGTVVLMDSKGDLINAYRGHPDAVIIEPRTANINPLELGSSTRTIEFLEYIFSALLETTMTPLQKTLFRSVLTLLLKVPNATLETFRQVLTVGWKPLNFEEYIRQCDPATQDFFLEGKKPEFDSNTYSETKQQILWRLRLILSNEYLRAIFTSPTTNVPFGQLLDSRKLIIIDNSKDDLGEEGAEFFGRFFVALVWMAAVGRSRLRPEDKVPVYFYIDECHTVIRRDTKVTTILDECRSQKIALVCAHQRIGQIEPHVMDALNNCAIRLANSDDDAEALAKRFRVEPAALRLPRGQFSCFVRDKTPTAVTINVPLFDLGTLPPVPDFQPDTSPPISKPAASFARAHAGPRAVPTDEVEDF